MNIWKYILRLKHDVYKALIITRGINNKSFKFKYNFDKDEAFHVIDIKKPK